MDSGGSVSTYALPRGTVLRVYEVSSVLGRGGFGVVYRAIHRELGADVAIKEFFPSELAVRVDQTVQPSRSEHESPFEDGLRRFSEEAKRLEAFRDCPSVVTCRDLFRANGTAYMVMDYIHGLPLSALLERREAGGEPFTQQDLLDVIEPLLAGLQVVHESGVYHRDIKPSNILIRQADNQPMLIDFGAAKQETAGLTKSMAPYTDGYAAMEQVGEGDIGPWTDVYGVGAVMWRIVAGGAPPFDPPNPVPVQRRAYEAMQGESDPMPAATKIGTGRFENSLLETIDACVRISTSGRLQGCDDVQRRIGDRGGYPRAAALPSTFDSSMDSSMRPPESGKTSEDFAPPVDRLRRYTSGWGAVLGVVLLLLLAVIEQSIRSYWEYPWTMWFVLLSVATPLSLLFWARRAYRLGRLKSAHIEFKTGYRYANGEGVQRDDREAFKWYLVAAQKGHADAQFNLGSMYEHGIGVQQDSPKAQEWLTKYSKNKYR